MLGLSPETLRNVNVKTLTALCAEFCKLCKYLLLAQGVVLELLGRFGRIHVRGERIMQIELPREDVHHDAKSIVGNLGCIISVVSIIGRL